MYKVKIKIMGIENKVPGEENLEEVLPPESSEPKEEESKEIPGLKSLEVPNYQKPGKKYDKLAWEKAKENIEKLKKKAKGNK